MIKKTFDVERKHESTHSSRASDEFDKFQVALFVKTQQRTFYIGVRIYDSKVLKFLVIVLL